MQDRTEERPARPGETCSCGQPAIVVFITDQFGETPYCGQERRGAPDAQTSTRPAPEDIRVERARLALTEYRGTDLGGMTIDDLAGWLGRFAIVLENLLEYATPEATR